jgi:Fe2+ or Zn2+ uptake regulation protein
MATPKCPKCDSIHFELKEIKIKDANFRHNAIICSSCGSVIAVEEFFNINARMDVMARKLGVKIDG